MIKLSIDSFKCCAGFFVIVTSPLGAQCTSAIKWSAALLHKRTWGLLEENENQHAVTHFKRDTFSLYEYALIFGSSVGEAVKHVSKRAAAYYTHLASYYKLPSTSAVTLPKISILKPAVLQVLTRNEEALMRSWAKKYGKSVR